MDASKRHWRDKRKALLEAFRLRHGVLSRPEIRELGFSETAIARLVSEGTIVRLTQGVYRAGAAPTSERGGLRADLLRAGKEAYLTRRSAAYLGGHLQFPPDRTQIAVPGTSGFAKGTGLDRTARGVVLESEVRNVDGLRSASPYLTLIELAADCDPSADDDGARRVLKRVLRSAAAQDGTLIARLRAASHERFPGARILRAELKSGLERTLVVRSGVEIRFVELCRRHGLPLPATNVRMHGFELDAVWADHDAFVEIDTFGTHGDEVSFERDREKLAALARLGMRGFQVTDRRIDHDAAAVARDVGGLLGLPVRRRTR